MSDVTLEPCPHCGSEPYSNHHFWHTVTCRKCSAEGPAADTEAEAIAAWNTRQSTQSSLAAENERLRQALRDVSDPLGKLRRDAEAQGGALNGQAYAIANDLHFVQGIARAALQGE